MTALFISLTIALTIICILLAFGIKHQRERIEQLNSEGIYLNKFPKVVSSDLYTLTQAKEYFRKNCEVDEVFSPKAIEIYWQDKQDKINNQYIEPEY